MLAFFMQKLENGHHVAEEQKAVVSIFYYYCFCVPSATLDCVQWSII